MSTTFRTPEGGARAKTPRRALTLIIATLLAALLSLCVSAAMPRVADAAELTNNDIAALHPLTSILSSPIATLATSVPSSVDYIQGDEFFYANDNGYYGNRVHISTVDGEVAYCLEPKKSAPLSGQYDTSSCTDSTIIKILYYGYGGPGYDSSLYPSTWYNGDSMTDNLRYAFTHMALAYVYGGSVSDAYYTQYDDEDALPEAFITWVNSQLVSFVSKVDALSSPDTNIFKAYYFGGGDYQTMVGWVYEPYGYLTLVKSSSNTDITDGNDCYSLAGAVFTVYDSNGSSVGTLTTKADGTTNTLELEVGTYTVKETTAPTGYALNTSEWSVTITSNNTSTSPYTLPVSDVPQNDPISILLEKVGSDGAAQGDATLAGAEFVVEYYDGYYDTVDEARASGDATKTWVFATNDNGYIILRDNNYFLDSTYDGDITSDELYYDSAGTTTLPLGTYVIYEYTAPDGYLLNDEEYIRQVISDGSSVEAVYTYNEPTFEEEIIRGGVSIQKYAAEVSQSTTDTSTNGVYTGVDLTSVLGWDSDGNAYTIEDLSTLLDNIASVMNVTTYFASVLGDGSGVSTENSTDFYAVPQAGAKFEGAEITIYNASETAVIFDGVSYEPNEAVLTLVLDETGYAATAADALPYGTYTLKETAAPTGYKLNSDWERTIEIREDGVIVEVTDLPADDENTSGVDDQVIRGDLSFVKIAEDTQNSLSYVPFLLVNNETGEAHVIVTDENGNFYSQSNWNAHTNNTNANDAALTLNEDGTYTVDYTLLDAYAGVWFTGYGPLNDPTGTLAQMVDPNDDLGALPYGTYSLIELSSYGNLGYDGVVITTGISVSRDGWVIEKGTITDEPTTIEIELGTTALDADTLTHYGNPVSEDDTVTIIDTVTFTAGLTPGYTYTFVGTLMSQTTGEAIVDADGDEITATLEHTVTDDEAVYGGSVEVVFEDVPYELVAGDTIIVFETLYDTNGYWVAAHEDIEDELQAIYYPEISTSAVDGVTYEHEGDATSTDTVTIIDTVTYVGLVPGETYVMTGTLYDKETGEAIEGVTASVEFTPEASSGTVEITFEVPADLVLGKHVVVFEECYYEEQLIAIHADINDEEQTVSYPEIGTTASDASDGDQTVISSTSSVIVDRVDYVGLTPGVEYTLVGTLYDQETGEAVAGIDPVTLTFTPESSDGYVEMTFTLDTTELVGRTLVVFERLYHDFNEDGVLDDVTEVVSTHEDINAESQSVFIANGNVADELLAQTGNNLIATSIVAGITALVGAAVYGIRRQRRDALK